MHPPQTNPHFLPDFEATTPASPARHARLRTALFLQTSSMYDASAAEALLGPHAPFLTRELAIMTSKVSALRSIPFRQPKQFILSTQLGDALEARSPRANRTRPHVRRGILHVQRFSDTPTRRHANRRACRARRVGAALANSDDTRWQTLLRRPTTPSQNNFYTFY